MGLTVSDYGSILAALAAIGSLWHSVHVHKKQIGLARELNNLQRELAVLELKEARDREISKESADFSACFVPHRKYSKHLVITNVGSSQARNVQIDFGEGPVFVMGSAITDLFPCDLDYNESVKLLASSELGKNIVRESFVLTWMDNAGGGRKQFNVQYA